MAHLCQAAPQRGSNMPADTVALAEVHEPHRRRLEEAFTTFLEWTSVQSALGQIVDHRPTKDDRERIRGPSFSEEKQCSDSVSERSLRLCKQLVRNCDACNLQLEAKIVQDLSKHTDIPPVLLLQALHALLKSFAYKFICPPQDARSKADFFRPLAYQFSSDPQRQLFCWVQMTVFGGVLHFLNNDSRPLDDVYIRLPFGRVALLPETEQSRFASTLEQGGEQVSPPTEFGQFHIGARPKYLEPSDPGAEQIYGIRQRTWRKPTPHRCIRIQTDSERLEEARKRQREGRSNGPNHRLLDANRQGNGEVFQKFLAGLRLTSERIAREQAQKRAGECSD